MNRNAQVTEKTESHHQLNESEQTAKTNHNFAGVVVYDIGP